MARGGGKPARGRPQEVDEGRREARRRLALLHRQAGRRVAHAHGATRWSRASRVRPTSTARRARDAHGPLAAARGAAPTDRRRRHGSPQHAAGGSPALASQAEEGGAAQPAAPPSSSWLRLCRARRATGTLAAVSWETIRRASSQAASPEAGARPYAILVVDDEVGVVESLELRAARRLHVFTATSGKEGLEHPRARGDRPRDRGRVDARDARRRVPRARGHDPAAARSAC